MTGDDWNDTVSIINKETKIDNFRFLSIWDFDPRMIHMDGMVGLAPDDPENGPSIVQALYDANLIEAKMFGFIFGKGKSIS